MVERYWGKGTLALTLWSPWTATWRRKGLYYVSWAAGHAAELPAPEPRLPLKLCRTAGSSYGGVLRELNCGRSFPAAPAGGTQRQLSSRSTIPFSSMSRFMEFRESRPKFLFTQLISTLAKISPTTSLYLLWKYQRRQSQSLWFISSKVHIAFGLDIRYNII